MAQQLASSAEEQSVRCRTPSSAGTGAQRRPAHLVARLLGGGAGSHRAIALRQRHGAVLLRQLAQPLRLL